MNRHWTRRTKVIDDEENYVTVLWMIGQKEEVAHHTWSTVMATIIAWTRNDARGECPFFSSSGGVQSNLFETAWNSSSDDPLAWWLMRVILSLVNVFLSFLAHSRQHPLLINVDDTPLIHDVYKCTLACRIIEIRGCAKTSVLCSRIKHGLMETEEGCYYYYFDIVSVVSRFRLSIKRLSLY